MAMRGKLITFEGTEGSGKSTQAALLGEHLRACGLQVLHVREPGGTATGEAIRDILQHDRAGEPIGPEAEALLFAASRAQLVFRRVRPALVAGHVVICDRFADSTTAYQGHGRGLDLDALQAVHRLVLGDVRPDLTFVLDLDVCAGIERVRQRCREQSGGPDRMEREHEAFHQRVREGYLALAAAEPGRFRVLNADRPVDAVANDIRSLTEALLS